MSSQLLTRCCGRRSVRAWGAGRAVLLGRWWECGDRRDAEVRRVAGCVANLPQSGCAGAWRRYEPGFCRDGPAERLCGAVATPRARNLSRWPRRLAVRSRCDISRPEFVAMAPQNGCAEPWRRHPKPGFCRLGPAERLCGAVATPRARNLSRWPRGATVRGRRDRSRRHPVF